jgi:hypothetical protein
MADLASIIRDGWFKVLSSASVRLDSNQFFQVNLVVTLWLGQGLYADGIFVPPLTIAVVDTDGKVVGQATVGITTAAQTVSIPGTFVTWEKYQIVVLNPPSSLLIGGGLAGQVLAGLGQAEQALGEGPPAPTAYVFVAPPSVAGAAPGSFGDPGSEGTVFAENLAGSYLNAGPTYVSIALDYTPPGVVVETFSETSTGFLQATSTAGGQTTVATGQSALGGATASSGTSTKGGGNSSNSGRIPPGGTPVPPPGIRRLGTPGPSGTPVSGMKYTGPTPPKGGATTGGPAPPVTQLIQGAESTAQAVGRALRFKV